MIFGQTFATMFGFYICIQALPVDLLDNDPDAEYELMVTVYTGSRRGAGTSAKVCLVVKGKNRPEINM